MLFAAAASAQAPAPKAFKLWPNGAPGSAAHRGEPERAQDWWVKNIHDPTVTAFPASPSHNSGTAIVVLPGGAHSEIVWTSEGLSVARAFNRMGINIFVVKYRLAREPGSTYSLEGDETADVRLTALAALVLLSIVVLLRHGVPPVLSSSRCNAPNGRSRSGRGWLR